MQPVNIPMDLCRRSLSSQSRSKSGACRIMFKITTGRLAVSSGIVRPSQQIRVIDEFSKELFDGVANTADALFDVIHVTDSDRR